MITRNIDRAKRRIAHTITRGLTVQHADIYRVTHATRYSILPISVNVTNRPIPNIHDYHVTTNATSFARNPTVDQTRTIRTIKRNVTLTQRLTRSNCELVTANRVNVNGAAASDTITTILLNRPIRLVAKHNTNLSSRKLTHGISTVYHNVLYGRPSPRSVLSILTGLNNFSVTNLYNIFLNNTLTNIPILTSNFVDKITTLYTIQLYPTTTGTIFTDRYSTRPTTHVILRTLNGTPVVATKLRLNRNANTITDVPL